MGHPMGLLSAKKRCVCVATEEEELCPESIKERCSDKKTRKKLGMLVSGWNHKARRPRWAR